MNFYCAFFRFILYILSAPNILRTIVEERKVLSKLRHPFICNLNYAFQDDDFYCLILDFADSGDLRHHLDRYTFTEATVRHWIAELSCALEYLHEHNIVHRDIKPENILVNSRGHVCLADFNIARELTCKRPVVAGVSGTFNYLAPEIHRGFVYTELVDWWALGVVFYESIYKRLPFRVRHRPEIFKLISGPVKYPDLLPPVSKECQDAVSSFLDMFPPQRVHNCEQVFGLEFFRGFDRVALESAPYILGSIEGTSDINPFIKSSRVAARKERTEKEREKSYVSLKGSFTNAQSEEPVSEEERVKYLNQVLLEIFPNSTSPRFINNISDVPVPSLYEIEYHPDYKQDIQKLRDSSVNSAAREEMKNEYPHWYTKQIQIKLEKHRRQRLQSQRSNCQKREYSRGSSKVVDPWMAELEAQAKEDEKKLRQYEKHRSQLKQAEGPSKASGLKAELQKKAMEVRGNRSKSLMLKQTVSGLASISKPAAKTRSQLIDGSLKIEPSVIQGRQAITTDQQKQRLSVAFAERLTDAFEFKVLEKSKPFISENKIILSGVDEEPIGLDRNHPLNRIEELQEPAVAKLTESKAKKQPPANRSPAMFRNEMIHTDQLTMVLQSKPSLSPSEVTDEPKKSKLNNFVNIIKSKKANSNGDHGSIKPGFFSGLAKRLCSRRPLSSSNSILRKSKKDLEIEKLEEYTGIKPGAENASVPTHPSQKAFAIANRINVINDETIPAVSLNKESFTQKDNHHNANQIENIEQNSQNVHLTKTQIKGSRTSLAQLQQSFRNLSSSSRSLRRLSVPLTPKTPSRSRSKTSVGISVTEVPILAPTEDELSSPASNAPLNSFRVRDVAPICNRPLLPYQIHHMRYYGKVGEEEKSKGNLISLEVLSELMEAEFERQFIEPCGHCEKAIQHVLPQSSKSRQEMQDLFENFDCHNYRTCNCRSVHCPLNPKAPDVEARTTMVINGWKEMAQKQKNLFKDRKYDFDSTGEGISSPASNNSSFELKTSEDGSKVTVASMQNSGNSISDQCEGTQQSPLSTSIASKIPNTYRLFIPASDMCFNLGLKNDIGQVHSTILSELISESKKALMNKPEGTLQYTVGGKHQAPFMVDRLQKENLERYSKAPKSSGYANLNMAASMPLFECLSIQELRKAYVELIGFPMGVIGNARGGRLATKK